MPKKLFPYPLRKKAFTLVEILVVIGIITILSALVITALNPPQLRRAARDTNRKKDISIVSAALEQYYADNNAYPNPGSGDQPTQYNCLESVLEGTDTNCAGSGTPTGTQYLKVVPETQSTVAVVPTEYCYASSAPYQAYVLCVPLESEFITTTVGGTSTCDPHAPEGAAGSDPGTDFGLYCIENPF